MSSRRNRSRQPVHFVVLGDIHGHWDLVAGYLDDAAARFGHPVDLAISVGDAEALRDESDLAGVHGPAKYRVMGQFPRVLDGSITLACPLVFIGGNHEPWPALDAHGPGPWGANVSFLGRSGATQLAGLNIAWLSGIWSPAVSPAPTRDRPRYGARHQTRDRCYFTLEEVAATRRRARRYSPLDVLITHDWPSGIGLTGRGTPAGNEHIRSLTEALTPTLHVCGHHHYRDIATIGSTSVEMLGHARSGPDAWAAFVRHPDGTVERVDA